MNKKCQILNCPLSYTLMKQTMGKRNKPATWKMTTGMRDKFLILFWLKKLMTLIEKLNKF